MYPLFLLVARSNGYPEKYNRRSYSAVVGALRACVVLLVAAYITWVRANSMWVPAFVCSVALLLLIMAVVHLRDHPDLRLLFSKRFEWSGIVLPETGRLDSPEHFVPESYPAFCMNFEYLAQGFGADLDTGSLICDISLCQIKADWSDRATQELLTFCTRIQENMAVISADSKYARAAELDREMREMIAFVEHARVAGANITLTLESPQFLHRACGYPWVTPTRE